MDQISDQVGQGVPLGHVDIQPKMGKLPAPFHQSNWMRAQMESTPHGSTTLEVAHGSTNRSMDQINHQVGHGVPQLQLTKTCPKRAETRNSSFWVDFLADLPLLDYENIA